MLKPLRDVAPIVAEHVGPMPYPALNAAFDALYPAGALQHYWKTHFSTDLTDEAIDVHLTHGTKVPSLQSTVHIYPINGACHRVAADETAFAYRDATFATVIAGMWPDPAANDANIAWVRGYFDARGDLIGRRADSLRSGRGRRRATRALAGWGACRADKHGCEADPNPTRTSVPTCSGMWRFHQPVRPRAPPPTRWRMIRPFDGPPVERPL